MSDRKPKVGDSVVITNPGSAALGLSGIIQDIKEKKPLPYWIVLPSRLSNNSIPFARDEFHLRRSSVDSLSKQAKP